MLPVAYASFPTFTFASTLVNDTCLLPESPVGDARIRMLCSFDIAVGPEFGQCGDVVAHDESWLSQDIYITKKRYSIGLKNCEMDTERMPFFEILYGIIIVYICSNKELRGEKKMEENTLTHGAYNETGYTTYTHDQLPELSASDLHVAATPADIEFMGEFMASENIGRYNWFDRRGFTLQNAGAGVLRCIHLVDAEYAFLCLAMANETIKLAGGVLELAPYTVVRPMTREADTQPASAEAPASSAPVTVGMEVA